MFGSVKTTNIADTDECSYSVYGIAFDSSSKLSNQNLVWGKNVVNFEVDMSSSVHIDSKGKDILILGKGPTQRVNGTTLTSEAEYSINFSRLQRKTFLSLHYNRRNSILFVN